MSDLLSIGASGVRAYRTALGVVADNVANADSPGYVRRLVVLKAAPAAGAGNPLTRDITNGSGVDAQATLRAYEALRVKTARNAGGDVARLAARGDWLTRLETVVSGGSAGLNAGLGGFYDGAQDLAVSPTSTAARTIFLDRADRVATAFRASAAGLAELATDLAETTATAVREVNGLMATLAQVNVELNRTQAGGEASNALLDERDRLLGELGTYLRIGVAEGRGGAVEVRLGEGPNAPLLLAGDTATRVGVRDGSNGAELVLDPTHAAVAVRLPASGSLAGLIEAARQVTSATTDIDALATRFAAAVNDAHALGVDATGADGAALFATGSLTVAPGSANAGTATVEVAIADQAPVDPVGYVLRRAAGAWSLSCADGSGTVSGAGPLVLDGVTISPSSGGRDGDVFVLATTMGAAGIALRPLAPSQLAVSARWLGDTGASNAGSGRLNLTTDPTAAGLPLRSTYLVRMIDPTNAEIVDPANGAVLATLPVVGGSVEGAGVRFTLTGVPVAGDTFRIVRASAGSADSGNLRALAATRNAGLEADLDASVAGIASRLSETLRMSKAATAVYDDASRAADAVSGVDLDREAAELTRLQAAYKANAQVIATARELFDALLQVVR